MHFSYIIQYSFSGSSITILELGNSQSETRVKKKFLFKILIMRITFPSRKNFICDPISYISYLLSKYLFFNFLLRSKIDRLLNFFYWKLDDYCR